jgi:hypothetical protein
MRSNQGQRKENKQRNLMDMKYQRLIGLITTNQSYEL